MNWLTKRFGTVFLLITLLFTMGSGHASAITRYDPTITAPTYSFRPILEDLRVGSDGSISGTAIIEPDYDASLTFLLTDSKGKEQRQVQILGGLIIGETTGPKVTTRIEKGEQKIVNTAGESIYIEVKTVDFTIPAESLDVAPGDYVALLKARNTVPMVYDVTQEKYSIEQELTIPDQINVKREFPGQIKVNKDGSIQISLTVSTGNTNGKFYFVVLDHNEKQVKRISFDPRNPQISLKSLNLQAGDYIIYLELVDNGGTVRSNWVSYTIDEPDEALVNTFVPGQINVSSDGTIQIVLQVSPLFPKAKYYVIITDDSDRVVKRIPISVTNPRISSSGLSLPTGQYHIYIEMVDSGKKYTSKPVSWTIPGQTGASSLPGTSSSTGFSIPSGQSFPGGIKVNPNGTITITLDWKQSYAPYDAFIIVYDLYGNVIKRIPIDLNHLNLALKDLKLLTGGYSVVIQIADPSSGLTATSIPTFVTINQSKNIVVFIDGQLQTFKKAPIQVDGRTLVPLRAIFEALGAKVDWDEATQTVTATKDNNTIKLTIGSKIAYKNGDKMFLDVPAQLVNGDTTMVPIRFVSEALGAKVTWDGYSNSVVISND